MKEIKLNPSMNTTRSFAVGTLSMSAMRCSVRREVQPAWTTRSARTRRWIEMRQGFLVAMPRVLKMYGNLYLT